MTNGAAPTSGTSASSFWSQKLQEDKAAPNDVLTNGVSKLNGVSTNGNSPNDITLNGIIPKLTNGTLTNGTATPKATLFHKTTAATLTQMKTASLPPVQSSRNSVVFKRKQLATVFADSNSDEKIDFPPDAKHVRIQQLEGEVSAKDERIKTLEGEARARDIHVQQLQTGAEFTIQQLLTLADEKDCRIAVLESAVKQKSELVQQLEEKFKALEYEASVPEGKEPYSRYNRVTHGSMDRLRLWLELSANINLGQEPTCEVALKVSAQDQNSPTQAAANDAIEEEGQPQEFESTLADSPTVTTATLFMPTAIPTRTPVPRDDEEPLFSTPETVKTGPPVPKAPLMVFPQKNTKNASASAPKTTALAAMTAPKVAENAAKGAWAATGYLLDVRNLSRDQREDLGRGPKVTITVGGIPSPTIPKKMLMQVSEAANNYFTKNPNANVMPFPRGCMVGGAVCEFAKWINDICTASKEFSVKIRFSNITKDADTQNLAIMQAARVLGMSTYVRHFTRHYCDEIRKVLLPLDTIARIAQFTTTDDPVYECLVNNMAHHRSKKNVSEQQQLEQFLVAHPRLAADLEKANAKIQEKREVRTAALGLD
jgi:hypothetical protein